MKASPARFVAFSDGSSLTNPGGPGGTGFVVFDREQGTFRFGANRFVNDGAFAVTNNRMELRAVLEALESIPAGAAVEVISDSRYTLDALSKWIHDWRRKNWITSAGQPVLNRDLIEVIDERMRGLKMQFTWCRGHDGHAVNEVVDALAQGAARQLPGPSEAQVKAALAALGLLARPATTTRGAHTPAKQLPLF